MFLAITRSPRGFTIVCERVASHLGLNDRAGSSSFAGAVASVCGFFNDR
jgi:hypothetical protein